MAARARLTPAVGQIGEFGGQWAWHGLTTLIGRIFALAELARIALPSPTK